MSISREVLAKYITPGCRFVETGARWGDSLIRAVECGATVALSCELDRVMAAIAAQHVEDAIARRNVVACVEYVDSPAFLRHCTGTADVLFLDAHTDRESPILRELQAVATWSVKPTVILIDDVRLFRSKQWGVSLEDVIAAVRAVGDYDITFDTGIVAEDVLVARLRT